MSSKGFLYTIFSIFLKLRTKYDQIAQDPKKKAETTYFGIYSIVVSIVVGGFFVLGIWGLILLVDALDGQDLGVILIFVLIVIVAVAELLLLAEYVFGGLLGVYYQFKCNRSPIGWVALAIYIVITVGMGAGILLIVNAI